MKIRFLLLLTAFLALFSTGRTQNDHSDPLRSAFRIARRADVRLNIPPGGCAVVFSGGFRAHSTGGVVPRPFDPDPDFYYLTGLRIPDAVIVLFRDPITLAEGNVKEILFLPDRNDLILRYMGEQYKGNYGLREGGWAIRPTTQWRKFCVEVLGGDSLTKVLSFPFQDSDYRKRGDLAYIDLGSIFYSNMAPGFPFDPRSQRFYREIVAADTAGLPGLITRVNAYLNYFPAVRRDPILDKFTKVKDERGLLRIQREIREIKIDLVRLPELSYVMRQYKSGEELKWLRKASEIGVKAMKSCLKGAPAGKGEYTLHATSDFRIRAAGGKTAMPTRVASGKRTALPYYNRNEAKIPQNSMVVVDFAVEYEGYCSRITRTLPTSCTFSANDRKLYQAITEIHSAAIQQCKPGTKPSNLVKSASSAFESIFTELDIVVNKAGKDKVLKVVNIAPIGLDLNELDPPPMLSPKMVFEVETAFYIPKNSRIKSGWHEKGIVIRDMVLVTSEGPEVLTKGFPIEVNKVEATCLE